MSKSNTQKLRVKSKLRKYVSQMTENTLRLGTKIEEKKLTDHREEVQKAKELGKMCSGGSGIKEMQSKNPRNENRDLCKLGSRKNILKSFLLDSLLCWCPAFAGALRAWFVYWVIPYGCWCCWGRRWGRAPPPPGGETRESAPLPQGETWDSAPVPQGKTGNCTPSR